MRRPPAALTVLLVLLVGPAVLPLAPAGTAATSPHHCVHGAPGTARADAHLALVDPEATTPGAVADALVARGSTDVRAFHLVPVVAFRAPPALADAARVLPGVTNVVPDAPVRAHLDSSARALGAPAARAAFGVTGANITIAVVDTGVDAAHASLDDLDDDPGTADPKVVGWFDVVNGRDGPYDDHGHGTHVASTAAGTAAGTAFEGVAPGARVVGVKVLDWRGAGDSSRILAGLEWIVDNKDALGVDVVTMSLGIDEASDGTDPLSLAANAVADAGLVVTVSAGNCGPEEGLIGAPAAAEGVLTVGASDDDGAIAEFSSRGPTVDGRLKPDVAAPGVNVTAATAGTTGGYHAWSGTSMATPHVAGLAALMLDATGKRVPASGIMDAVRYSARDAGAEGPDHAFGHGLADAPAALELVTRAPFRDVAVARASAPAWVPVNESAPVNVTLTNQGERDEHDVRVRLVQGNATLAEARVPALASGARAHVTLTWPGAPGSGLHDVRVLLDAFAGERVTGNNARDVTLRTIGCRTPGPDAFGYACRTRPVTWLPLPEAPGTRTTSWWEPTERVPLGFTFHWYGDAHDSVRVGNGWLTFDAREDGCCSPPWRVPDPYGWNAVVLATNAVPFTEELVIRHATVDTPHGAAFVVEYTYDAWWPRSMFHAQVQLHEDGHVVVAYRNLTRENCERCVAGIEDASGRVGLVFAEGAFDYRDVAVEYRALPEGWREGGVHVEHHAPDGSGPVSRIAVSVAHRHDAHGGEEGAPAPPVPGEALVLGLGGESWFGGGQWYWHVPFAGRAGTLLP